MAAIPEILLDPAGDTEFLKRRPYKGDVLIRSLQIALSIRRSEQFELPIPNAPGAELFPRPLSLSQQIEALSANISGNGAYKFNKRCTHFVYKSIAMQHLLTYNPAHHVEQNG